MAVDAPRSFLDLAGNPEVRKRFYAQITSTEAASEPEVCWEWTGIRNWKGYGEFSCVGRHAHAHRVAWELAGREIPAGLCVLHHCDNPSCVRVEHLWLGTSADNNRDRHRKGRSVLPAPERRARGAHNGQARFGAAEARRIYALRDSGRTQKAVGREFGVSQTTISNIWHGKSWRSVTLTAMALLAVLGLGLSSPTSEARQDKPDRSDWFSPCQVEYLSVYTKAHEAGYDVGANLVDDFDAKCPEIEESKARLKGWLRPVPATPAATAEPTATSTVAPASGGSGCPSSMYAESGAAGYGAYNASSGATGCYQVIPSTAEAFNCDLSTPAGQDACAAAICAGQGSSAWAASGANPC